MQPPRGVLKKRCSEDMQENTHDEMYFNKVAKQLY